MSGWMLGMESASSKSCEGPCGYVTKQGGKGMSLGPSEAS